MPYGYYGQEAEFSTLAGKTLASVTGEAGGEEMTFATLDGERFKLFHRQDCCESVSINDICGELQDLVGSPVLSAEESTSDEGPLGDYDESFTWTFYKLATIKGSVTIRWYGASNGYYSESVDFVRLGEDDA